MNKNYYFSNRYFNYTLVLILGLVLGWVLFHPAREHVHESTDHVTEEASNVTIWTCSMHPNIRMTEPGKCPICGMDLIPLVQGGSSGFDPDAVHLTPEAVQLANITSTMVTEQVPYKDIRLYGRIEADESRLQSQVAHIGGRIENLDISITGESISRGQLLGSIYSPELVTAQQELLEASLMKQTQPVIYEAAKEKLRQWKMTDEQIAEVEESGKIEYSTGIYSNTSGVVTSRKVSRGDYVSQGSVLFEIADLSKVWIIFDVYENDIQFLKKGTRVSFSLQSYPGETFRANIEFIDPVVDPVTRVSKARAEASNTSGKLKPGMFATGIVRSLPEGYRNNLVIPRSAVLWTGKRSVVYVKLKDSPDPVFKMREVVLGPSLGNSYVVTEGLVKGEEIVTSGAFSVDATAQLEGKTSMMNRPGEHVHPMEDHVLTASTPGIVHESFNVAGKCEMCKDRIESTARSVNGVISANWDLESKILHLDFNSSATTLETVQKAIAAAGHDNGIFRAPDDVYANLPECCHYRE